MSPSPPRLATGLSPDPGDPYLQKLIRIKAKKLIGKRGLTRSDLDDLVQEIWLDLVQRLPGFDPNRSQQQTFLSRLIDHKLSNILRDRSAQRRDGRRCRSLNVPLGADQDVDRANLLAQDAHCQRTGCSHRPEEEQADLAADVAQLIAPMSEDLRDLCRRLPYQPLAAIAREMGIPRTTLQESVRKIRRRFENAGLREYMNSFRQSDPETGM